MIEWPSNLPGVLAQGYSEGRIYPKKTFSPEQGGPIERRSSFKQRSMDSWTVYLTEDELLQFERFVDVDLKGATQRFRINHPRRQTLCFARLVGEEPYTLSALGGHYYSVEMVVEVT